MRISFGLIAVCVGVRVLEYSLDLFPGTLIQFRTENRCDGLVWGAVLALALQNSTARAWLQRRINAWTFFATITATIILLVYFNSQPERRTIVAAIMPILICHTVLNPHRLIGLILEFPLLKWIGRVSYSLYIWQTLFLVPGIRPLGAIQTFPLALICPIVCAILSYYFVERVLTKDSPENRSFFGEGVKVVVEVVVDPQRQIDHFDDLGDDLRAAAEPCEKVADVAVVLFDGDGQVFAGEELVIRDEAVITLPIIGDERLAFEADFVEELLACGVITATKNPGDGSPSNRVIGSPKPQFLSLFFTKCHISSRVTTTTSALVDGSGSLRASSRTQFRTATSLTPRMRAMEPKLTLPMA